MMDKSMVKGFVIGGAAMIVLTGGAVTGYRAMTKSTSADVVPAKEAAPASTTARETAGAAAGHKVMAKPTSAEVVAVKEVTETVTTPREECQDVQVQKQAPVKDENRLLGTVVGGVAGGLLGSRVGGGKGKTVATVAGAAAGGYAGNQVQKNMQQKDVVTSTERQCKTVNETSKKLIGYDVTYRFQGEEKVVRTSFKPGATIPIKDGQPVLVPDAGK
jgi:uncharacterized protein YcfJ